MNVTELMKRDNEEREKAGDGELSKPGRPPGMPFSRQDFKEMKKLGDIAQKGELLDPVLAQRYKDLCKEDTPWRSYTDQDREYRRLKQLQEELSAGHVPSEKRLVTRKDFVFFAQRNAHLRSRLPFFAAMLGIHIT